MDKKFWIIFYFLVLASDLFAVYDGNETLRYITKPLLMPLLVIYFVFAAKSFTSSLKKWIVLALAFSWAGDVLLMFDYFDEVFFILGLVSFLVAHIFYISCFSSIEKVEKIKRKLLLILIGIAWYYLLIIIIKPSTLGSLAWPLRIYGAVLMVMFIMALHMGYVRIKWFGLLMISGALLFVISDSLLAVNKFYHSFEYSGIAVMSTYGIAQLLITLGAVRYITSTSKQ